MHCITYVHSSFAILGEEERAGFLAFIIFRMSCYCKCSVALPHGSVDCLQCVIVVFLDHTHFFIGNRERSGSVVECLTRDQGVEGSSLTGVTVLWSLSKIHLS